MIENFSKNVARLRKEFGYSQEELAKKLKLIDKLSQISNVALDILHLKHLKKSLKYFKQHQLNYLVLKKKLLFQIHL